MTYFIPSSLEEALALLGEPGSGARVVAGATDIFPGKMPARAVDISTIPEMCAIETAAGHLLIGAAVTHAAAASSSPVRAGASALAEACALVGSPQIRNIGTLGGNVVNAAPAADAAVALAALGARALVVERSGRRREEALEDLYAGFNRSVVDSGAEIVLRFILKPCREGEGSAFLRFAARRALALPLVNAAARVRVEGGRLVETRLVVAPVRPAPTRLYRTEEMLRGASLAPETWSLAEKAAAGEIEVRGSILRCSARYREHLAGVLASRVLRAAAARACGGGGGAGGA